MDLVIISLQHFLQAFTQFATDVLKPIWIYPKLNVENWRVFCVSFFKYWKLLRSSLCLLLVNGHCTTAAHLPATDFLIFANYFNLQILPLAWESSLLNRRFSNSWHNSLATNNRTGHLLIILSFHNYFRKICLGSVLVAR